jgi:membrane protease YdiL (CAAX protease family)
MNPLTRLFRRSRTFRVLLYVSTFPLWAFILFISFDSFGNYSEVGDVTILALIMLFALWAWWYDEDRDRRQATKTDHVAGNGGPPARD